MRVLARRGLLDADAEDALASDAPALSACYEGAFTQRVGLGPMRGRPVIKLGMSLSQHLASAHERVERAGRLCARIDGFDLHGRIAFGAADRTRLEELVRYCARPPLAYDRLTERADGRYLLRLKTRWRDGTTHLLLEPRAARRAIATLESSLFLSAALGMHGFNGVALIALAETYLARGEAERARESAHSSLAALSEAEEPFSSACALRTLGRSELAPPHGPSGMLGARLRRKGSLQSRGPPFVSAISAPVRRGYPFVVTPHELAGAEIPSYRLTSSQETLRCHSHLPRFPSSASKRQAASSARRATGASANTQVAT